MIQKIRSYLLDNEENKNSMLFIAAIILIGPSVFVGIFDSLKKTKDTYAKVNNIRISKKTLQIKMYDQKELIEEIRRIINDEGTINQFMQMLYGGRSPEEFVYMEEISKAACLGFMKKNLNFNIEKSIQKIIENDIKKNEENSLRNLGKMTYLALTGNKEILQIISKSEIKVEDFEEIADSSYKNLFIKMLISTAISILENSYKKNNELIKVNFDILTLKENYKNNEKIKIEKTFDLLSKEEQDNILLSKYHFGLENGLYKSESKFNFNILKIKADEKALIDLKKKWNIAFVSTQSTEKAFDKMKKGLENFDEIKDLNIYIDEEGNFDYKNEKIDISIISKILNNIKKNKIFYENGFVYISVLEKSEEGKVLDYKDVRKKIKNNYIKEKLKENIKELIEKQFYIFDEFKNFNSVDLNIWEKRSLEYLSKENENEKNENKEYNFLKEKILKTDGIRIGTVFANKNKDKYEIYGVSRIENKKSMKKTNNVMASDLFIKSIEKNAKIEMY